MRITEERTTLCADGTAQLAQPVHDDMNTNDLDMIVERAADARHVSVGGASHGTSDDSRWRAPLTQRLITDTASHS